MLVETSLMPALDDAACPLPPAPEDCTTHEPSRNVISETECPDAARSAAALLESCADKCEVA